MGRTRLTCSILWTLSGCFTSPPVDECAASVETAYIGPRSPEGADALWGVADLHAHPATHLAFAGDPSGEGGFIWSAPGLELRPECAGDLEPMKACDPQTHASENDAVRRQTRRLIFGEITKQSSYPHASRGADPSTEGGSSYVNWPHGRDVFHQQMQISGIRRAYEGGLRLMIASATDNAVLTALLDTDAFPGDLGLVSDLPSLEAQLDHIIELVERNPSWMELVTSPEQAERAIRRDRLAVILSVEGDFVPLETIERLYRDKGLRHVGPVHLVDNPVGGTALFNDVFYAASRLEQPLFGAPARYPSVIADPDASFRLGRPVTLEVLSANLDLNPIGIEPYRDLGLEERPACRLTGIPPGVGHRNARGLRRADYVARLLDMGILVDVAHMGGRAVNDTLRLAHRRSIPVMSSHTGVRDRCRGEGSERDLERGQVACIGQLGGVIGLGTGGSASFEVCGSRDPATVWSVQGAPLAVLSAEQSSAQILAPGQDGARPTTTFECPASARPRRVQVKLAPRLVDLAESEDQLTVSVVMIDGQRFEALARLDSTDTFVVDIEPAPPPPRPGCPGPEPGDAETVRSVDLILLDPNTCRADDVVEVEVEAVLFDNQPCRGGPTRAELFDQRPSLRLFDEQARSTQPLDTRWRRADSPTDRHQDHVQVRVRSGHLRQGTQGRADRGLGGAAPFFVGAEIRGRLWLTDDDGSCRAASEAAGPNPWFSLNHRAQWSPGFEYTAYVPARPSAVCGLELELMQPDLRKESLAIDLVRIEAIADPVGAWVDEYRRLLSDPMEGRPGSIALGTDINGLFPQIPFAKHQPAYPLSTGGIERVQRPPRIGSTTLVFAERGLAGYVMLPEFFASVDHRERVGGETCEGVGDVAVTSSVTDSLFRSAAGLIEMWRRVTQPAASLAAPACEALGR